MLFISAYSVFSIPEVTTEPTRCEPLEGGV